MRALLGGVRRPGALPALLLVLLVVACGHARGAGVRIALVKGTPAAPAVADASPTGAGIAPLPTVAPGSAPTISATGTFKLALAQSASPALANMLASALGSSSRLRVDTATYPDDDARVQSSDLAITRVLPGQALPEKAIGVFQQPIAIALPFSASPDDVTTAQAVGVISGSVSDWQQVGGSSRPLKLAMADPADLAAVGSLAARPELRPLAARTGDAAALLAELDAGTDEAVVVPWNGPWLHAKALRIDGRFPSDAGYPLVVQYVVTSTNPQAQTLAQQLAAVLTAKLTPSRDGTVTIDAMGDVMLARGVAAQLQRNGNAWPFALVADRLRGSDLRFANLELALTERGVQAHKDYTFRAPPTAAQSLAFAGINVADLANNHILDYGGQGLLDTIAALGAAGVQPVGAGADPQQAHSPVITVVNGLRVAWLAYVNVPDDSVTGFVARSLEAGPGRPGVAWGTTDAVRRDVLAAKQNADVVIVALHSGFEYTQDPNPIQRDLAHTAIDAGAALVLGAHPHVLQGIEYYHGGVIAYSLGNFIFDLDDADRSHYGLPSVLSVVLRVKLDAHGVTGLEAYPVIISSTEFRPVPVAFADARPIYERLDKLTDALNPRPAAAPVAATR